MDRRDQLQWFSRYFCKKLNIIKVLKQNNTDGSNDSDNIIWTVFSTYSCTYDLKHFVTIVYM